MKKILFYLIPALIFNTAIAAVLTVLMPHAVFWVNLIYSHCIGLSVLSISLLLMVFVKGKIARWAIFSISLPVSVAIGLTLAFWLTGLGGWGDSYAWTSMLIGLFFGLIGAVAALLYERIEQEVKQRKLLQSESEKREIEAHLKMLQAQIEPHFLFNTLANVASLIDSDPVLAKKLLERLNDWLRMALARARSDNASLGDELDMLENYLQILKIRFGERLYWNIEVTEADRLCPFPPMLLQPLVENAVRHGIEPKMGGGVIDIGVRSSASVLSIEVSDSGVGLIGDEGAGAGLANVRERLATLFGAAGKLILENRVDGGVRASLELPK